MDRCGLLFKVGIIDPSKDLGHLVSWSVFKGKFSFSLSSCAIKDKHSPATGNVETAELAWIGYASFKEMLRDEPFQTPPIGHFLMRLYAFMIRSPMDNQSANTALTSSQPPLHVSSSGPLHH